MADRPTKGILYVATGESYWEEAKQSALSFREKMPDLKVAVATRGQSSKQVFDRVIRLPEGINTYVDKIIALQDLPFEQTLYLDTDTYCVEAVPSYLSVSVDGMSSPHMPRSENTSIRRQGYPSVFLNSTRES